MAHTVTMLTLLLLLMSVMNLTDPKDGHCVVIGLLTTGEAGMYGRSCMRECCSFSACD